MILELEWAAALFCVLVIYLGATVQSSIGIGMGMIAAPLLALVDSSFVPTVLVIAVLPLSALVAWADRHHIEPRGVGVALIGRVPGAVIGALVAAALSTNVLGVLVAASVLLAVAASVSGRHFEPTEGHLAVAGLASGFTGTTTGVGGPPMALTYQHADPVVMRASLSAFFAVGALMSLIALAATGQVTVRQLQLSTMLLPGVLLGVWTARRLNDRLDPRVVRPAVLAICTISSLALLARVIF